MKTAISFLFLTLVTSISFSQVTWESSDFINYNLTSRGFQDAEFLFSNKNVGYYKINKAKTIVAIHDKDKNEKILDLKLIPAGTDGFSSGRGRYVFSDSEKEIIFFKKNILPLFPDGVSIEHYVKNIFLEVTYGYNPRIEKPIIQSGFRKDRKTNKWKPSRDYYYLEFYVNMDRNTVSKALEIRKEIKNGLQQQEDNANSETFELNYLDKGLKTEELIKHIFLGNFDKIPFNRENNNFRKFVSAYIYSYSNKCSSNLPDNKVQLYRDRCVEWDVTKENGVEVSRTCSKYVKEATGIYAKPELYKANNTLNGLLSKNVFKIYAESLLKISQAKDFEEIMELGKDDFQSELSKFIEMNGCTDKGLRRFEENLVRFVENIPSIKTRN